ncbi:Ammonium_transporter [Hexamita inflata]|uniref:Amt family n=1 Tax=Hexamita inflata TaxID=28002 RepID=A0AA86QNC1_9EUKA|nr:Ammonium transporter [Hexamita inflata]
MTQSPTGPGTPMAGSSRTKVQTQLVVWPLKQPLVSPHWPWLLLLVQERTKLRVPSTLQWFPQVAPSSGSVGLVSMPVGGANARAANAAFVTHLSGSVAAATWMLLDWILHKKCGVLSIVNGAVAGLVCITPACGYVQPASALAFGVVSAVASFTAFRWRKRFVDDPFDAFACHGVSGFIGMLLTGVFAENKVINVDGIDLGYKGGWIDHHYIQLAWQCAGAVSAAAYSFGMTFIIVKVIMYIAKLAGTSIIHEDQDNIDDIELGENAQQFLEPNKYFSETHHKKEKKPIAMKDKVIMGDVTRKETVQITEATATQDVIATHEVVVASE